MKERLIEHRNQKRTKINAQEEENKTSSVQRVRLRGDWSDTGRFILLKTFLQI
jgi:hypothetical protein